MNERSIILIGGKPGAGKTTLAGNIVRAYDHADSVATFSLGQEVRDIYDGEVASSHRQAIRRHLESDDPYTLLPDAVAFDIAAHALRRTREASLVLIDGFPRRYSQVSDLHTLSAAHDYTVRGMIEVGVDDDLAVARQLMRRRPEHERPITSLQAKRRVEQYHEYMPANIRAIHNYGIYIDRITTTGSKDETLKKAMSAITLMMALGDIGRRRLD